MSVVGFDIGTTFSKVAVVHQKKITIVPNDLSKLTTPTLMAFTDNERLFGEAAVSQWARNYKCTIPQIKRLIGRQADDPSLQQELQDYFLINTAPLENGRIGIEVDTSEGHATIAPEQALAPYLSKLKEFTSQYLENLPIRDCVITCPNYFDDAQRRALLTAAKLSDLNVLRLMNESTAIALNYGLLRELPKEPSRVIFCDVGESNTQVSVVDFVPGKLTMRYVAVDPFVGGRNFDLALFKYFSNLWQKQNSTPIHGSKRATLRLMRECNNVKKILSANRDCILPLDCFLDDVDFTLKIDRETAEKEWEPILQNILKPLQEAIEVTKNDNIKITSVEMVGGASRIPSVQEKFLQYIKSIAPDIQSLSWTLNGDETVARGAALMCAMESPVMKVKEFQIQEINTWPVAIEYASDKDKDSNIEQLIIDRLNPLPCTAKLTFHKTQSFEFKLKLPSKVQVNENTVMNISFPFSTQRSIGTFSIASIPLSENLIGDPKIKLCISLNKHGIVDWPQGTLLETIKRVKPPANEQKTQMSPSDIKINGTSIPTPTTDRMDVDPQQQQQQQQDQKLEQKQQCQEQLVQEQLSQEQQPQQQQQQQQQQSQPQNQKEPMDTDASEENGNEVTNKNENGDENRENKENSNTGNQAKDGATPNIDSKDDTKEHVETNDDPNTDNQNISNPKLEEKKSDKKKIQRNLQITGKFENVIPIETFNKWFDFEASLSLKDKVVRETLERRNELETYIYTTRNKLDSEYKGYVNEVERDNLIKKLTENEEWLYGEGENANRSSYVERLKNLRSLSDLIDSKYQEGTTRPKYIEKLKKLIGQYQSFVNETDNPLYDHITQEEKNQVKDYATKCDEWLTEKIIQQERIPLYEKPTLLTKEIDDKYRELMNQCRPIVTKPKPEPPKEEKKENVDGNANGNPNSNTDTNINGHTDLNTNAQDTAPSQKQESSNSSTDPQFEQKEQPQQQSQTNKDNTGAEKDPMDIEC